MRRLFGAAALLLTTYPDLISFFHQQDRNEKERSMRDLGIRQQEVIRSLVNSKAPWTKTCGWFYESVFETERILESLVQRGLVVKLPDGSYDLIDR